MTDNNIVEQNPQENIAKEAGQENVMDSNKMGILNDVSILLTIEIGRTTMKIKDLLSLSKDSVIDLNKSASDQVDIYANGKLISKGVIITANGNYCVKLVSIPENK